MPVIFAVICYATWAVAKEMPDIFNAGAVLHQLSYQANWELVITWFYGKPVDCGFTYLWRSSALKYCFHPQFTNMKFHALILHDI